MKTLWQTNHYFPGIERQILTWVAGALAVLLLVSATKVLAQTCPPAAVSTAVGVTATALRTNGIPIGPGTIVQVGEPFIVQMAVFYLAFDPLTLGTNAAFENGQMLLSVIGGSTTDVTPPGGVPRIGGDGTPGCDGAYFFQSLRLTNTATLADEQAGSIQMFGVYRNGDALLGDSPAVGVVNGEAAFVIRVGTNGFGGEVCPPYATSATVGATVAALRTNGVPIGTDILEVGEPFIVRMAVIYYDMDPITLGANAAFKDGQLVLSVRGNIVDVTPPGGVPVLGPSGEICSGVHAVRQFLSLQLPNIVTEEDAEAGSIEISGVYTNGYALLGLPLVIGSQAQNSVRLGLRVRAAAAPLFSLSRGSPPVLIAGTTGSHTGPEYNTEECGTLGSNSRWYKMRAYDTGLVTISTEGSSITNPRIAVCRGLLLSPDDLTPVGCNENVSINNLQSRLTFEAIEDAAYWVVVDPRTGDASRLRLAVGFEPQIEVYGFTPDGAFALQTGTGPHIPYTLRASTDIGRSPTDWTILLTTNLSDSFPELHYRDDNAKDFPQRFYRIGPPP